MTERFPLPPPQLEGNAALYDYLYQLTERLNLMAEEGDSDTLPAAASEAPLSARQTRALVQRTVAGLTAEDIHGGDLSCGSVTASDAVTAASFTASGAVTAASGSFTGTVALGGETALTLGGETLAAYVQRCIAAAISNEEENT